MNLELSKIIELVNRKEYQKALELIKEPLKSNPRSFPLNKILAVILMAQEKFNSALAAFNKCFEIKQNDYDVNVNIAFILIKVQDYKNALKFCEYAIKTDVNRPEVYHNFAHCYLYISDLEKAEKNILKSIELRGGLSSKDIFKFKDTLNIYTDILLANGNTEKFKEVSINLLNRKVFFGDMFRKVLRHDPQNITQEHIKTLYASLDSIDDKKSLISRNLTKASIYSCLAEYYNKIDKKKSENYYLQSNELIINTHRSSLYESQNFTNKIIKISNLLNNDDHSINNSEKKGDGLIFIIGMPRSGTTLLESIVSTADDCIAGGEKVFFPVHCQSIIKKFPQQQIDKSLFQTLGQGYLDLIEIQKKNHQYFIDKLPENYLYYDFIRNSLPAAKFIHIKRDPWDNAISIFKSNFMKELFYASSFFGIALQYANYEHLVSKWKSKKNNNILEINYEDLVSNTQECIDKIWSFCNLQGKYVENERKKHFAQTASKQQVSQSIYSSSLKKSEFEEYKEEFFKNLELQRNYWNSQ